MVDDGILNAVSYTHLDVYKRQTRGRSRIRAGETEKEIDEREQEIELITDSEMEQQTDEIAETEIIMDKEREPVEEDAEGDQIDKAGVREIPVSYTHLTGTWVN